MTNAKGEIVGVVEVYVDQTATSNLLHDTFTYLAAGLALAFTLAFGLPWFAYFARTQQKLRRQASG